MHAHARAQLNSIRIACMHARYDTVSKGCQAAIQESAEDAAMQGQTFVPRDKLKMQPTLTDHCISCLPAAIHKAISISPHQPTQRCLAHRLQQQLADAAVLTIYAWLCCPLSQQVHLHISAHAAQLCICACWPSLRSTANSCNLANLLPAAAACTMLLDADVNNS